MFVYVPVHRITAYTDMSATLQIRKMQTIRDRPTFWRIKLMRNVVQKIACLTPCYVQKFCKKNLLLTRRCEAVDVISATN